MASGDRVGLRSGCPSPTSAGLWASLGDRESLLGKERPTPPSPEFCLIARNWEILTAAFLKHSPCFSSFSWSRGRQFPRAEGGGPADGKSLDPGTASLLPTRYPEGSAEEGEEGANQDPGSTVTGEGLLPRVLQLMLPHPVRLHFRDMAS